MKPLSRVSEKEGSTNDEKLRKYEEIILQLKVENRQLEDDLNAAFERETDLQKALESQRAVASKRENEGQRQATFEAMNEIERLNEVVFRKNREISEKMVEISNLGYKLTQQKELAEEVEAQHQQDMLQLRHGIDTFKLSFEKQLLAKDLMESKLTPVVEQLSYRLLRLSQKVKLLSDSRRAEIGRLTNVIEQAKLESTALKRDKRALENKIDHLEQTSLKFKEEIGQLKTIHGLASINSQKELNSLRYSMKEFLEKHRQRIKTIKMNCEEFLAGIFNQFSVWKHFGEKKPLPRPDFESFFNNLKKITSVKFCNQQRELACKTLASGGVNQVERQTAIGSANVNTLTVGGEETGCKSCQLLKVALADSEALLKEQQAFFESQKRILTAKKIELTEERASLKKVMQVNDEQYKAERTGLIEKLETQQKKLLELTAEVARLSGALTDARSLNEKYKDQGARLTDRVEMLKTQKEQYETKIELLTQQISENDETRQKMSKTVSEKARLSGYVQELRSEVAVLRQNATADAELIAAQKERLAAYNDQLAQKEELITSFKDKIERLSEFILCPKHKGEGDVLAKLKSRRAKPVSGISDSKQLQNDHLPKCIECLQTRLSEAGAKRSESRQTQQCLSRKDEIIKSLQIKLEETENQLRRTEESCEEKVAKLRSKIVILEADNRKIGKQNLESTRDIETLKTCLNEFNSGFEKTKKKSSISPQPVNKHLAETCKLLDIDVSDLDLFLDPKPVEKPKRTQPDKSQISRKTDKKSEREIDSLVLKCRDNLSRITR